MPTTDPHGDTELIARIHDWLVSLWTNPEAAAQFAQSPAVSMASHNLNQDSLNSVSLRHIAGDVASTPGIPTEGRNVLTSFANSPSGSGSSGVRDIYHVTREVYHDQPVVEKIFQDNSVHIDNSQTLVNNGIIDGNISLDNNSATAVGQGAVAAAGGSTVNAATGAGAVANQGGGDVNQASGHGQVVSGSDVGQNTDGSPGSVQVGGGSSGAVNTGDVHGTQAGGGATGNVTGDGNQTATQGSSDGHFGSGQGGDQQGGQHGGDQGGNQAGGNQPGGNQGANQQGGDQTQGSSGQTPGHDQPVDHSGTLGFGQGDTQGSGQTDGHGGTGQTDGHTGTGSDGGPDHSTLVPTQQEQPLDHAGTDHLAADGLPESGDHTDGTSHLQPLTTETDHSHDMDHHLDPTLHA